MTLPAPTLDHVVVNARDRLDEAAKAYRRLGFTLTPRGFHTLGSANHLAMFGTDYLELIGAGAAGGRLEIMAEPPGLNGLVFGTEDSDGVYAALLAAGVPVRPPLAFSRPVALPEGVQQDAAFRTVGVEPAEGRPGRLYFCHHLTRGLVWRDAWRQHANGAVGVVRAVIASEDPALLGALFGQMFGPGAVQPVAGGVSLVVGLSRLDVLAHAAVAALLGAAAGPARPHYMAALTLRTRSLGMAAAALAAGGVIAAHEAGRILVPAAAAMGCPIEFVAG